MKFNDSPTKNGKFKEEIVNKQEMRPSASSVWKALDSNAPKVNEQGRVNAGVASSIIDSKIEAIGFFKSEIDYLNEEIKRTELRLEGLKKQRATVEEKRNNLTMELESSGVTIANSVNRNQNPEKKVEEMENPAPILAQSIENTEERLRNSAIRDEQQIPSAQNSEISRVPAYPSKKNLSSKNIPSATRREDPRIGRSVQANTQGEAMRDLSYFECLSNMNIMVDVSCVALYSFTDPSRGFIVACTDPETKTHLILQFKEGDKRPEIIHEQPTKILDVAILKNGSQLPYLLTADSLGIVTAYKWSAGKLQFVKELYYKACTRYFALEPVMRSAGIFNLLRDNLAYLVQDPDINALVSISPGTLELVKIRLNVEGLKYDVQDWQINKYDMHILTPDNLIHYDVYSENRISFVKSILIDSVATAMRSINDKIVICHNPNFAEEVAVAEGSYVISIYSKTLILLMKLRDHPLRSNFYEYVHQIRLLLLKTPEFKYSESFCIIIHSKLRTPHEPDLTYGAVSIYLPDFIKKSITLTESFHDEVDFLSLQGLEFVFTEPGVLGVAGKGNLFRRIPLESNK